MLLVRTGGLQRTAEYAIGAQAEMSLDLPLQSCLAGH